MGRVAEAVARATEAGVIGFDLNSTGIATDSLFPGHPGLPQDHARWDHNKVHSNNSNYYTKYVDTGVCDKPMAERGYITGTATNVDGGRSPNPLSEFDGCLDTSWG